MKKYQKSYLLILIILNISLILLVGGYQFIMTFLRQELPTRAIIFNLMIALYIVFIFANTIKTKKILTNKNITMDSKFFDVAMFLNFYTITSLSPFLALLSMILYNDLNFLLADFIFKSFLFSLMFGLYYFSTLKKQLKEFWQNIFKNIILIIVGYITAVVFNIVGFQIAGLFKVENEISANQEIINQGLSNNDYRLILILTIIIFAPIFEELFFRFLLIEKILIPGIKLKNNKIKFYLIIIIAGLVFATAHAIAATTIIQFFRDLFMYLGFSLALSLIYYQNRNIYITIGIHFINNFLSVLIFFT